MLADKLYNLESFKRQYRSILLLSVCNTIPNLEWKTNRETLLENIDWNNIISIASALCFSEKNEHLDATLRIAQTAISEASTSILQKDAAAFVLLSLTNKRAVNLAIERNFINSEFVDKLPLSLKIPNQKVNFENTITLQEKVLELNKFQSKVYRCFHSNDAVSISAPTSAGKSFILCNLIIEEILLSKKNVIYIVPTRALISQVENDFRNLIEQYNINKVGISTVPQNASTENESNIWVFTQERLHWYLSENNSSKIDILIIDEAHKIEDGYRGILLQQKLEEVIEKNPEIKVLFSSPFTSNPELLLENVNPNTTKEKVNTQFVAVNQNLIFATQIPKKTDRWKLSLSLTSETIELGTLRLFDRPNNVKKKMAFISTSFSNNQNGNMIYCNGASEAEETALVLMDALENETISNSIKDLITLIKNTIHKDYRLAKVLEKRIAFHYGNMPLLIRQEIERLFKVGEIKYLICTSTLLEGVNLPAKSIFIRNPNRGKSTPLNANDFWNLAGRAGRWGQEFSGNIICIEPQNWINPPNPNKSKQKIVRAIDIVTAKKNELFEFIKNKSPREEAEKRQDLEFAFGYQYNRYIEGKLTDSTDFNRELINLFKKVELNIKVPNNILKRNPGISPYAQQSLLEYFQSKDNNIESLFPVYPEDNDAYNEYINLIECIGKTISLYPHQLSKSRSILLIYWMTGKPLSFIIKKAYKSYQNSDKPSLKNKSLHTVIREVMENVENFVRFRFAKDSSCYVDILREYLKQTNRTELIEEIPQLNLWLEFGVSQKTHLSLLSLGLTRNTVIELSKFITRTNLNEREVLDWLNKQDFSLLDLSPIILQDILKIIKSNNHSV